MAGIERGFDTQLYCFSKLTPTAVTAARFYRVCTVGDMSYTDQKTVLQVKDRASENIRRINGMRDFSISIQVMKGTDPADSEQYDFAAILMDAYKNNTPLYFNFGGTLSSGGTITGGETICLLCSNMSPNAPVDDLYTYTADLGISAIPASSALTPSNVTTGGASPTGGSPQPTGDGEEEGSGSGSGEDNGEHNGDIQTEGNP